MAAIAHVLVLLNALLFTLHTASAAPGESCEFNANAPVHVTIREEPSWVGDPSPTNTPRFVIPSGGRVDLANGEVFSAHYNYADNLCCIKRGDGVLKPYKQREKDLAAPGKRSRGESLCTSVKLSDFEMKVDLSSSHKQAHALRLPETSKTLEGATCKFDSEAQYFVTFMLPPAGSNVLRGVADNDHPVYMVVSDRSEGLGNLHPSVTQHARPMYFDNLCCAHQKSLKLPSRICSVNPAPTSMLDYVASVAPQAAAEQPKNKEQPKKDHAPTPTPAPTAPTTTTTTTTRPPKPTKPQPERIRVLSTTYQFEGFRGAYWETRPECHAKGRMMVFKSTYNGWEDHLHISKVTSGGEVKGYLFAGRMLRDVLFRIDGKDKVESEVDRLSPNRYCCNFLDNGHSLHCIDVQQPQNPGVQDPTEELATSLVKAMADAKRALGK